MREVLLNDVTSGNQSGGNSLKNPQETHKGEVFANDFKSFQGGGEGSLLNANDRADTAESLKSTAKTSPEQTTKIITLHSKYGNTKATFETNSQSIMLPFTKGGEYFVFDSVRFYVLQGEGALYYLDCVKDYDFKSLSIECLEQFLLTGKQPRDYKQRELINDFLRVDTKNIQKNKNYLLPKDYETLQIYLMGDFYDN